jgi:hypothetical protein
MTILALLLTLTPVQSCAVDLPLPPTSLVRLGQMVAASEDWVVDVDDFEQEVHVWERTQGADAVYAATLTPTAGRVRAIDVDGDRIAVVAGGSLGSYSLNVWEPNAGGTWVEGPPLAFTSSAPVTSPVQIEGDTLAVATQNTFSSVRRISVFDFDPQTDAWAFSQEIINPINGAYAFDLRLEAGRIYTVAGPFSNLSILAFQRSGGSFALDEALTDPEHRGFFDASGDRLAIVGDDWVDVWRREASGWVKEQRLDGPGLNGAVRVELADRWLSATVAVLTDSGFVPGPVQVYGRPVGSEVWLAKQSSTPLGGLGTTSETFGRAIAGAGGQLFVTDPEVAPFGRITGIDLSCLGDRPVLHWANVRLSLPAAPTWPAQGRAFDFQAPFSFDPGPAYGLRDANLSIAADYVLDITGRACDQDYGSNVCAFAAFAFQDALSGVTTSPFPIDPFSGNPQLFDSAPGPLVSASTTNTQIPWPFLFEGPASSANDLEPSGAPMELQFAANMYNCIDFGGIWAPDDPNVEAFACGNMFLPVSVTSLQFDAAGTGKAAFKLPALGAGLQTTICDGGVNGAGFQATLEAVGSSDLSDNALYFDVTGLIPGTAGLLFISPEAATPPFSSLGFGSLCLGAPFSRVPGSLAIADDSGNAALRLDLLTLPQSVQPQPGSTWAVQWMYRDQGFVNTTSARTVLFQ